MTHQHFHNRLHPLRLRRLRIDTYQEAVVYMPEDCHVCRSEGFSSQVRVEVSLNGRTIVATVQVILGDLLSPGEASLSESAWKLLEACEGAEIKVRHAPHLNSLSHIRTKVYGNPLGQDAMRAIIGDIVKGRLSDIHLSSFITACSGERLATSEMIALTQAMVEVGTRLTWSPSVVADKHCVGGLPGNRTTPIVVAIVAACGLTIPKTSSRAITSPAGTADTMETLAPVNLDLAAMRRVVEQEGGCVVWGGSVALSPADDILIRVERVLDSDSQGLLVASVLSKKVAAGSTHLVIDVPVGPTAKVRDRQQAEALRSHLEDVAKAVGLQTRIILSDGEQPVGRGIGPALEARDLLAVLQGDKNAPQDLKERSLLLAGELIGLTKGMDSQEGIGLARDLLQTGAAWKKFQAICQAQGGMREPTRAKHQRSFVAAKGGRIVRIDNRRLARVAKLAGAPRAPSAGVDLHISIGHSIESSEPLFTLHAETAGELNYAWEYLEANQDLVSLGEPE